MDPEEQIICPYNNSHYIRRKRMAFHLTKCKAAYEELHPDVPLRECDFNVTHKVPDPELQYHHETCPDRKKIEIAVYQDTKTDLDKFPIVNIHVATEESWDNDNVASYDPEKYCMSNEIIRHKDVISAAKRRNFRLEERKRIGQFSQSGGEPANSSVPRAPRQQENQTRRPLPDHKRGEYREDTPGVIEEIVQRIKIDAKNGFYQNVQKK